MDTTKDQEQSGVRIICTAPGPFISSAMTGATRDALIVQTFTKGDEHFTVRRAPGDCDTLLLKTKDGSK